LIDYLYPKIVTITIFVFLDIYRVLETLVNEDIGAELGVSAENSWGNFPSCSGVIPGTGEART
jgi:hypothetical protein